jgi:hypothetical protein
MIASQMVSERSSLGIMLLEINNGLAEEDVSHIGK